MNYAHPTPELERVLQDVTEERKRQIALGWTPEHDDTHDVQAMVFMARDRALEARQDAAMGLPSEARRHAVQAAALLVAAVESMDRKAARRG